MQFSGGLTSIYTGASNSATSRWLAADFIDRVLFASPSTPCLYWPGGGQARPIPGLPDGNGYDGIEVFDGRVVVWRGNLLKWSDPNDFSSWIPVATTIASGRAVLESDFVPPAVGSTTGHVYLSSLVGTFYAGQFVRIVTRGYDPKTSYYDFFKITATALATEQRANAIKQPQAVPVGVGKTRVFVGRYDVYVDWTDGARLQIDGVPTQLKVVGRSRNGSGKYTLDSPSDPISSVAGSPMRFSFGAPPDELRAGDVVSVGPLDEPGQNLYQLTTAPAFQVLAARLPFGNRSSGSFAIDPTTYVSFQNWVEVENAGTTPVSIPPEARISTVSSLVLEPLGFTGGTPIGKSIPVSAEVESVDANGSGELLNVGSSINGDILAFTTLAEYGYIFKQHSIQSVQAVGIGNGTYYLRTEVHDEGLVGRYAWCRAGNLYIAFFGNKGFYLYGGGQNLKMIADQHYRTVRDEMDRSRSDEVVAYHNKRDSEIWFIYPTLTNETKVLIYNYTTDSVVIDLYSSELNGITAAASIRWELAPTWESLDASEKYTSAAKRWYEYVDEGERDYTLLGIGGDEPLVDRGEIAGEIVPRLLVHGRVWHRASRDDCAVEGAAYPVTAETPDFDFGDPQIWKYVDTVFVTLAQKSGQPADAMLNIQVGGRDNLNSPLRWSAPQSVGLREAGAIPTKINTTVSGRYIRVRFSSNTYDANWGITSYQITARKGGTY